MSYYKTRAVRLKKNGKISVTVAENNVYPLDYFTTEYGGTVAEFLYSCFEGNFRIANNKANHIFFKVVEALGDVGKMLDSYGLTWESQFTYKLSDRRDAMMIACEEFAKRIENGNWTDPHEFDENLGERMSVTIWRGMSNLKKAKEEDEKNGVIRVSCAAYSIFEGYDLLMPKDGKDGFILAPEKDYKSGVLKTDPANIVPLGKESENLYAFLSHAGLGCSMREYIEKCPSKESAIRERFALATKVVKELEKSGLVLKDGVTPFLGYKAKTAA